jgi:hypothetical protein
VMVSTWTIRSLAVLLRAADHGEASRKARRCSSSEMTGPRITMGGDLKNELGARLSLFSLTGFTEVAENRVDFARGGYLCGLFGPLSKPGALLARRTR